MLSGKAHCRTCGSKSHTTENCKQEIKCFRCNGNGHFGHNCKVNGWNIFYPRCVGENMLVDDRLLVEVGGQFLRACVSTKINDNFIGIKTAEALFGAINDKERKSFSLNDYTFTNIGKIAVKLSNGSDGARAEVYVLTTDDFEKIHDKASIIIGKKYATNMKSARAVGRTIGRREDDNGGYVGRGGRIMGIAAQSQLNQSAVVRVAAQSQLNQSAVVPAAWPDDNLQYEAQMTMGITDGVAAQSQLNQSAVVRVAAQSQLNQSAVVRVAAQSQLNQSAVVRVAAQSQLNQSAVVPAAWPDDNLQYEAQMTMGITDGVAAQSQLNQSAVVRVAAQSQLNQSAVVRVAAQSQLNQSAVVRVAAQSQLNQSAVVPAAWPDDNLQYEAQMTIVQSSTSSNAKGEIRRTTLVLVEEVENSSLYTDH